jgi:thiol:disulfide interchange protein DsbD
MGLGRLLSGMAFVAFAISLLPGMFGGRLGDLDAYVPPPGAESGAPGGAPSQNTLVWLKDQYRAALDQARREGKLVLVNFTGYACTNCHWMKANMFTRPEVAAAMKNFVLVEVYTDGTDAVSEENQKLQLARFNTVAIPYYAILDPDEKVIATFPGLTKDPAEYLAFLGKGTAGPAAPVVSAAAQQAPAPAASAQSATSLPQVPGLDGRALPASEFQGKVVVVNFWATWCVPCIQEIPGFNKLHRELGAKGVKVVGISMDEEGAERVKPFLERHPMEYTVGLGSEAISTQYGLDQLPVTLVFDRTGKQIKRFEGFISDRDLDAAVRDAL